TGDSLKVGGENDAARAGVRVADIPRAADDQAFGVFARVLNDGGRVEAVTADDRAVVPQLTGLNDDLSRFSRQRRGNQSVRVLADEIGKLRAEIDVAPREGFLAQTFAAVVFQRLNDYVVTAQGEVIVV